MIVSRSNDCPYCGENHANLCYTVYDNGDFCFSCHKGNIKSDKHFAFRPRVTHEIAEDRNLVLPAYTADTHNFSPVVLEWLYSYYLFDKEIKEAGILYCPAQEGRDESVLMTIKDEAGNIIEYQRRFFPKSFFSSSGVKNSLFIKDNKADNTVCLVEDYISTLRVGTAVNTLCLFGTDLNTRKIEYIIKNYSRIFIWLDPDAPGIDAAKVLDKKLTNAIDKLLYDYPYHYQNKIEVVNVKTEKQPKDYSNSEISQIIRNV